MRLDILAKYDRPVPRYTSYPTAPHFHDRIGPQAYADWLAEIPPDEPLSLYVHIPFCDSLCWFCGCHTKIVRRYAPVRDYLEVVGRELDLLVERLGGPRRLRHLHFGGGTPTILEPRDVREVGRLLHRHFTFGEETDFAVEIDPREVRREMLAAWADIGLTRASLGVQDVNPDVQEAVNRIQPFEVTARVVEWLRASGIRGINFDLMYGLPLQTAEHLLVTVDKALTLEPERLALFGYAHVPWMKRHQRLISDSDLPGARDRLIQSEAAHGRLAAAGYVPIGLDHFARPDDPLARALENGTLHRNFQGYTTDSAEILCGLGASAIGSLPQGYAQNTVPIGQYAEAVRAGRLPVVRGVALSDEDRLRRAIIERLMCDLQVDLAAVADRFGQDASRFGPELAALRPFQADGLVEISGDTVRVRPHARPMLRTVCAVFDVYLETGAGRHSRAV